MKTRLLKSLRQKHVIRQRNNKYCYTCYTKDWDIESPWIENLQKLLDLRRTKILSHAHHKYKHPKERKFDFLFKNRFISRLLRPGFDYLDKKSTNYFKVTKPHTKSVQNLQFCDVA